MEKVQIVVRDFDTYREIFPLGSVYYIQIGIESFPSDCWTDLTTSVMSMWAENLSKMLLGIDSQITLFFMDGDYSIGLQKNEQSCAVMYCYGPNNIVMHKAYVDLLYFSRQLISAANVLLMNYSAYLDSQQLQEVISAIATLRESLKMRK